MTILFDTQYLIQFLCVFQCKKVYEWFHLEKLAPLLRLAHTLLINRTFTLQFLYILLLHFSETWLHIQPSTDDTWKMADRILKYFSWKKDPIFCFKSSLQKTIPIWYQVLFPRESKQISFIHLIISYDQIREPRMYLMTETLRGFDTIVRLSTTSAKGDSFCFPASDLKRGLLLKERICSHREQILSF